ncbi:MAG TPA: PQQ-binding-like beta-propeller repeat protein [Clostridia bacterium]|nr:PQQ-binding-like beta-propeller repeat protein [Clostridia bacterium]
MKPTLIAFLSSALLIAQLGFGQTPGTKLWEVRTPGPIVSSPAVAEDGTVYVSSGDGIDSISPGWLSSFSPQGTTNWVLTFPRAVRSSPAIGPDGTVYVGCVNGDLKIVTPAGTYQAVTLGGYILASPAIGADGTVYVGSISSRSNKLFALSPEGVVKWVFTMRPVSFIPPGPYQFSSPAIGPDGTIYVGSIDKNLYAINPDGTTNWVFPLVSATNSSPATASPTYASPAIGADGTIYIGADNGVVYAIDPKGVAKWKVQLPQFVESSAAVSDDGTIYLGCAGRDGAFYALRPDGTEKWSFPSVGVSASPALAADGSIYVGGFISNQLYAFSSSGSVLWSFPVSDPIFSSPTIGPDGTIYFGAGKRCYAVYGTNTLMNSAWPMFRGNVKHTARSIQRGIKKTSPLPDGNFAMNLTVETGRTYKVEYSTDLANWSELSSIVSATSSNQFLDLTATNSAQRYYRLKAGLP